MKLHLTMPLMLLLLLFATFISAADYRVELLEEAPPTDEIAADIAAQLEENGYRVIRGTKTTYCDIWLCKEWAVKDGFEPQPEILYPFASGQLIGVARFGRRGADFRDQDIDRGIYTMRYATQPVDGAHVGTSPTRDFLLLVRAEDDTSPVSTEEDVLNARSSDAAQSSHPCLLAMQAVGKSNKFPSMRHNEDSDWWVVGLSGNSEAADKKRLPIEFVISGQAVE